MLTNKTGTHEDGEGTRTGVSLMLGVTGVFAVMDALTKHVSTLYPAPQILWIRYIIFTAYGLAITIRRRGWEALQSNVPALQITRGLLLAIEILAFIVAFRYLPLADVQAVAGAGPLLTTALSFPILGEKVGIRRWAAVGIGLIGLLIIIRPGMEGFKPLLLLPLSGTVLYAFYLVLTRVVARHDRPDTTVLYTGMTGLVAMSLVGPFFWEAPDVRGLLLMICIAILGLIGHGIQIKALSLAPASVLQPLSYFTIVWATILGYVFYNDLPDLPTVIGALIIAGSGLYTFHRERVRAN